MGKGSYGGIWALWVFKESLLHGQVEEKGRGTTFNVDWIGCGGMKSL